MEPHGCASIEIHVKLMSAVIETNITIPSMNGAILSAILHHPMRSPQGAAILCHGMESEKNSEKLIFLAQSLAERGILALRFDFRYVGESSGKFADITYSGEVEDLQATYGFMQSRQPGKTVIFGSSMGGTVALLFAAQEPSVAAVVTLAAPGHPENFPKRVLTPKQLQRWRECGYTSYNGQRLNVTLLEDLERIDVAEAARRIRCPVLILHGDADEVVPVAEAYELHEIVTVPKRLSIFRETDHRFSNPLVMRQAMAQALDWLAEHVS
jgi:alpha/beta superfamily hydrolase